MGVGKGGSKHTFFKYNQAFYHKKTRKIYVHKGIVKHM